MVMDNTMDPSTAAAYHDRRPAPRPTPSRATRTEPRRDALGLLTGAASIYAFGLATSVGHPAFASFGAALGLIAAPLAFVVFYAPSLWVLLALFDRPVASGDVATAASRGLSTMGALLAGLVPAALFFELTAGGDPGQMQAFLLEMLAFGVAGLLGLRTFVRALRSAMKSASGSTGGPIAFGLLALMSCLAAVLGLSLAPKALIALHGWPL
jgi:hypothetical protein